MAVQFNYAFLSDENSRLIKSRYSLIREIQDITDYNILPIVSTYHKQTPTKQKLFDAGLKRFFISATEKNSRKDPESWKTLQATYCQSKPFKIIKPNIQDIIFLCDNYDEYQAFIKAGGRYAFNLDIKESYILEKVKETLSERKLTFY